MLTTELKTQWKRRRNIKNKQIYYWGNETIEILYKGNVNNVFSMFVVLAISLNCKWKHCWLTLIRKRRGKTRYTIYKMTFVKQTYSIKLNYKW